MDSQNEASILGLARVPPSVNKWDIARHLISILHAEPFSPPPPKRQVNFKVKLDYPEEGGGSHLGTGILTLPSDVANKFLRWVKDNPVKIDGNKIKFYPKGHARERAAKIVLKSPFIHPDKEEDRQNILWDLDERLRVNVVQFGILFRERYPSNDNERLGPRSFSTEWEHDAVKNSAAWLEIRYDNRLFCITVRSSPSSFLISSVHQDWGSSKGAHRAHDLNSFW
jgi:RNA-dependent RNA polymerase